MVLNIELPQEYEDVLRQLAKKRGVPLEDFARQTLIDLASTIDEATFDSNLTKSIEKHDDLLKRLS